MSTLQNNREKYLRETCRATDAELTHINSIRQLKQPYFGLIIVSNCEPSEILDSWLFQGNWQHANDRSILESLSITHIVNVTDKILSDQSRQILHISSQNGRLAELSEYIGTTNEYLDRCHQENCRVLVHCERGVSRSSTIILAYLMHYKKWTILQAFECLLTKRPQASPNHALLLQLVRHEYDMNNINQ